MTTKTRYPREQAHVVALRLKSELASSCEMIEIAGSLRRGRADVGDIEFLCVPRTMPMRDLFGDEIGSHDLLTERCLFLEDDGILKRRGGFGPQNKLLVDVESGIPVDVFSTTLENWGMSMVVRTGPADFNVRLMSEFKRLGHKAHAYGGVTLNAYDIHGARKEITCPTEESVFEAIGWKWLEPEERR